MKREYCFSKVTGPNAHLELWGELHDDHHPVYDPPRQPRTLAEILDWFASESVPDTAFSSDVFDVHFEAAFRHFSS
jgi:hypothetical protein